jgi:hypothetical protein
LRQIQSFFGVGTIRVNSSNDSVYYSVTRLQDLINVIIPHFDKYPLITQKRADFLLFKMAVELINQKEHLTTEGLHKILSIRASMNKGLRKELIEAFPEIIPVERPKVEGAPKDLDPNWLAGFSEGESCFEVKIYKSETLNTGYRVQIRFTLTQHSRDTLLMNNLVEYF